jgi:hypothetical protein
VLTLVQLIRNATPKRSHSFIINTSPSMQSYESHSGAVLTLVQLIRNAMRRDQEGRDNLLAVVMKCLLSMVLSLIGGVFFFLIPLFFILKMYPMCICVSDR